METLNISKNDDIQINLCDSPGFFEIFSDDKAIISSLGVPLIVQNAKNCFLVLQIANLIIDIYYYL